MKKVTHQHEAHIDEDTFLYDFTIYISEDRHYGADADGRRGEYRAWIDDYRFSVEVLIDNKYVELLPSDYQKYDFDIERYAKRIIDNLNVEELI